MDVDVVVPSEGEAVGAQNFAARPAVGAAAREELLLEVTTTLDAFGGEGYGGT